MRKISLLIPAFVLSAALPLCAQTISGRGASKPITLPGTTAASVAGPTGPRGAVGPKGDTGATGATGMGLAHVVILPAGDDPAANGAALLTALGIFSLTPASAAEPAVIQLDAGTYTLPATAALPPFVSLTGFGMLSTVINGNVTIDNGGSKTSKQSISNLGIQASSGAPLIVQLGKFLLIDHVQLSGGTSTMTSTSGNAHFLITNSLLGSFSFLTALADGAVQGPSVNTIIATQVDPVSIMLPAPGVLNCLSDYTSAGTVLSSTCQ